uniref:Uncharacterized protein n=1 Tax=Oryza barthii TaxID=65489 RepID=A0A0D3F5Y5_9ORYZ
MWGCGRCDESSAWGVAEEDAAAGDELRRGTWMAEDVAVPVTISGVDPVNGGITGDDSFGAWLLIPCKYHLIHGRNRQIPDMFHLILRKYHLIRGRNRLILDMFHLILR